LLTGGGGNNNYWHWLYDVLPRLELCKKVKKLDEIDFFLFPNLENKFQKESLEILNIPSHKLLSSKKFYDKKSMNDIEIAVAQTDPVYRKRSFVYDFEPDKYGLFSLKEFSIADSANGKNSFIKKS